MTTAAATPARTEESPFHPGEKAVQARAGMGDRMEQAGRRMIRDHMPDQHREFFSQLPSLFVGSLDAHGCPWASVLVGRPGFLSSPDERTLRVEALPGFGDPLGVHLAAGAPIGLLGLEPQTRRRNRMNGAVTASDGRGFTVSVEQSYGNCPQFITPREPRWAADPESAGAAKAVFAEGARLSSQAALLIAGADTFFIASASPQARAGGRADGVDMSHRGGERGFVRVHEEGGATVLTVPDYRGNFLFNTLGNIAVNPRAGLLFIDPESGDALQLTGSAEIDWDGPEVQLFQGAQRLLRFTVQEGVRVPGALPLRFSLG